MRSILYVLCGIQASGKTTLAKELQKDGFVRYSFDELDGARNTEIADALIQEMHNDAIKDVTTGHNVVLDADYTRKWQRRVILNKLNGIDCEKILLVLQTPYKECLRRNAQRKEPVPEEVIQWRKYLYEMPELSEGWDEIYVVSSK